MGGKEWSVTLWVQIKGWQEIRLPTAERAQGVTDRFLMSSYFVPRSVAKKGVATYLKERLIRLGIPFLVGLLLINNQAYWLSEFFPGGVL